MGASGGIGQPLSLLLKNSPLVTQLSLYDIVHTPGVAADLSHINSPAKVTGFVGPDQLAVSAIRLITVMFYVIDTFSGSGSLYFILYIFYILYTPVSLLFILDCWKSLNLGLH